MTVAMGLHSMQLGGSQINTIDLSARLRDMGHRVVLWAIDSPEDRARVSVRPIAEAAGFDVIPVPTASSLTSQARRITALVDAHDADVLHVHHEDHWLGPLASIALRSRPGRVAVVTNWMMRNNRWLPPHAPLIVGTEALRDEARTYQRGPVWLLEPPVNVARDTCSEAQAARFRRAHGLAADDLAAVLVTRVDRAMKLESILLAIAAVERLGDPGLRLVIVGDGDAMDTVRRRAAATNRRLGTPAVVLTGTLHDPRSAYGAADIVLGMGGSALRGLAFARPVVVLGARGFARIFSEQTAPYFLRHGFYGTGEDEGSGAALAAMLAELRDEDRRRVLGGFGARIVRERFSLEAAAARLTHIYADALASPPGLSTRWYDSAYLLAYSAAHRLLPPQTRYAIRRRLPRLRAA